MHTQFNFKSAVRDSADVAAALCTACVVISASHISACSGDSPGDAEQPTVVITGPSSTAAAGATAPQATMTSQPQGGTTATAPTRPGTPAGMTMPMMPAPSSNMPAPAQAPRPGNGETPPPLQKGDCAAMPWVNPGGVPAVTLKEIPANAGSGRPAEQVTGLSTYGYDWKEFLFTSTSPAYTSRLLVKKPRDPAKFSGTVFVEWYNVSGGADFAVLWGNSKEYFMREGHAFIGVSAQSVGTSQLAMADPGRYGEVKIENDNISNAVFGQAGNAIKSQTEALLGPCMPVRALIAIGQSQSSARLTSYVNTAQPKDQVYDGLMLHSGGEPATNNPAIPTFVVLTMTEGNGRLMDGPNMVKWNVAGASHNDLHTTTQGAIGVMPFNCKNQMNNFPAYRVYNAALHHLHLWVRQGTKPPAGMRFQMNGAQRATDAHGNVLGGVRSADIEVPIAMHGLENGPVDPNDRIASLACGLGGQQVPFSEAELTALYPTHDDYVAKYTAAAEATVAAGYWLQADRDAAVMAAQAARIPK